MNKKEPNFTWNATIEELAKLRKPVSGSAELDYSLKTGEQVWFTYKTNPMSSDDWIEAEILDLNWAYKAAALQLKGYKGVSCQGISALSRVRHYH